MQESSSAPDGYQWREVRPAVDMLAFKFAAPDGWNLLELPEEDWDFSDPTKMVGLAVCMPSYAACVFSVGARPAYSDGTLEDWFRYLLQNQEIEPETINLANAGQYQGLACMASQPSDAGPMRMRLLLFEDSGRLFSLSALAPAPLWGSVEVEFRRMFESFALLEAGTGDGAEHANDGTTYASVAIAEDASALDPEHPVNANIRDGGNGLVPNISEINEPERYCTVAAGAIRAVFRVPFGWHVIDDGRRTLVFNASGEVQVNLNLLDPAGRSDVDLLTEILAENEALYPDLQHLRLELAGMSCLALRGLRDGDTELEQAYLIREAPGGFMLKTRVTATPGWMVRAMNLAGLIHQDLQLFG